VEYGGQETDKMVRARGSNLFGKVTVFFVICCFSLPSQAKYGGGSGTPEAPYLISDANHMQTIGIDSNDWDKCFKLMADIDLAGFTGTSFNIIGINFKPFSGVFDGSGHTISNFTYISTSIDYIGLFRFVHGTNAEIKDLGLIESNVDAGTGNYVGSLIGHLYEGTIRNCYVEVGSVSGGEQVGGLVGHGSSPSIITNCYSETDISGARYVGGLVGKTTHLNIITNCYSTGRVESSDDGVGGLVGWNYAGTIINCYSTSRVDGNDFYTGGLVGMNYGTIINSCSMGDVTGYSALGGLVGKNETYGTIINSYAMASVSGAQYAGGLVGGNHGTIINCCSTGDVSGLGCCVGGLVGWNFDIVSNCFWDVNTQTHGVTKSIGRNDGTATNVVGLTTAQMHIRSNFTNAGWDFVGEATNGIDDIWVICEAVDYPKLKWQFVIGDFDGDDNVNFMDFTIFAASWKKTDSSFYCGGGGTDLTDDGDNDFPDLKVFVDNWLAGPPPVPASNPDPPDGRLGVIRDADLSWTSDPVAKSHNVYFGTSEPPPFIGNQTTTTFDPGTMSYSTTYYWRVDETGAYGIIPGVVWSFTTLAPPPP
jgi:hypothetical protein